MLDQTFFITTMPASRPADYYLSYMEECIFMDFNNVGQNSICLKRISFDGYGCCELAESAIPMDEHDSKTFRSLIQDGIRDQDLLRTIVMKTIGLNKKLIWTDALNYYELT